MDAFRCDECRTIYEELRAAFRPGEKVSPEQIGAFVEALDFHQCARLRVSSDMWKAWRRMQEHRVVTGHVVSPSGPATAVSNTN